MVVRDEAPKVIGMMRLKKCCGAELVLREVSSVI
jgi:hypothetical protein